MSLLILLLTFWPHNHEKLGAEEWSEREKAQKLFSNTLSALLLPEITEIDNPEIRMRVREIKRQYAWFLYPKMVEQRVLERDEALWFWTWGFDGTSQVLTDWGIRHLLYRNEIVAHEVREICRPYTDSGLWGSPSWGEQDQMRFRFDKFNKKSIARCAVIGGLYSAN